MHRGAVETEDAAALEDTVDDGEAEVLVVQAVAPVDGSLLVVTIMSAAAVMHFVSKPFLMAR